MSSPHFSTECAKHHHVVRDYRGPAPKITVLCGSTRFSDAFRTANLRLTLEGHIVLSIGCDTKSDADLASAQLFGPEIANAKMRLDRLHMRKIDLADEVLVLNVGGYIGESTRNEITYATRLGKPIRYLETTSEALPEAD
ncbi:hypothetical protein [Amycolatopsis australiensis]|uniref:Uncharacterized protein n=1 Tax=Amycolatopsis australiensis TaxID=546364 RepID=A0A1K1LLD4_9PSEU|nr:hypothetical protein [Amycolatopsis australiensis]SFW11700.1 hypothetical protein SAMN04489730_0049 [Amycolatopsis australiensis]